jgi:hypothetical protein
VGTRRLRGAPIVGSLAERGWELRWRVALTGLVAMALAVVSAQPAQGATIQVPCSVPSLIGAIDTANGTVGADTLNLASGCTYILVARDNAFNGLPVITSEITINGSGATIARASSAPSFRILAVSSAGILTLNRLTVSGGLADADCPNPFPTICGGGIASRGTLTVKASRLIENTATGSVAGFGPLGGAVANAPEATVTLTNSEVSGNTVGNTGTGSANGGGIGSNGSLTIISSRVADNTLSTTSCVTSCGFGAGINSFGFATLRNSIVSGNTASTPGGLLRAAGIVNGGSMAITGTAIRNNRASAPGGFITGGGIATGAALSMTSSIISDNTATAQGGTVEGAGISVGPFATLTVNSSAVRGNSGSASAGTVSGGGIANLLGGTVTTKQSTISNNAASAPGGTAKGGGIFHAVGATTLNGSAVTGNSAGDGGGIYKASGTVTLSDSVVRTNAPNNCSPPGSISGCAG